MKTKSITYDIDRKGIINNIIAQNRSQFFYKKKTGNPMISHEFPDRSMLTIFIGCPVGLEPTTFRTTI